MVNVGDAVIPVRPGGGCKSGYPCPRVGKEGIVRDVYGDNKGFLRVSVNFEIMSCLGNYGPCWFRETNLVPADTGLDWRENTITPEDRMAW